MANEHHSARSRRIVKLTEKFRSKRYRDSYVSAHNRKFVAQQIRALRGDMSQEEFGKLIGKPQSVVSRIEDPAYGKFTQQTLHEVAASLDRAVITQIVDFKTFLCFTEDMSDGAICPAAYNADALDRFALEFAAKSAADEEVHEETDTSSREDSVLNAHSSLNFNVEKIELAQNQSVQITGITGKPPRIPKEANTQSAQPAAFVQPPTVDEPVELPRRTALIVGAKTGGTDWTRYQ